MPPPDVAVRKGAPGVTFPPGAVAGYSPESRPSVGLTSCQVLDDLVQGVEDAAFGLKRYLGLGKQLEDVAVKGRGSGGAPGCAQGAADSQWPLTFPSLRHSGGQTRR